MPQKSNFHPPQHTLPQVLLDMLPVMNQASVNTVINQTTVHPVMDQASINQGIRNSDCFLCRSHNPPYDKRCWQCKGVLPTHEKFVSNIDDEAEEVIASHERNHIHWKIFSFGSQTPVTERSPLSFPEAMQAFATQDHIAICLVERYERHLLVRYPQLEMYYSVKTKGSETKTNEWDVVNFTRKVELFGCAN